MGWLSKVGDFIKNNASDLAHGALDVLGMVPVVGFVADLANAGLYLAEGNYVDAAMSAFAAIPGIGDAAALAKGIKNGVKAAKTVKKVDAALGIAGKAKTGAKTVKVPKVKNVKSAGGYKSGKKNNNLLGKDRSTKRTENVTEWRRKIDKSDIGDERKRFLGDDYVKVGEGKWRSLDGNRQFRVKPDDYSGAHGIGRPTVPNTPHAHFEFLKPRANGSGFDVTKNIHVPLK